MIARTHRFHGQKPLLNVYRRGETFRQGFCTLKVIRNTQRANYRLAVVISKKISKSAVVRNRIRRRIFEVVRQHENLISGGPDMIITVFSDQLETLPASELEKLIVRLLQQAASNRTYQTTHES